MTLEFDREVIILNGMPLLGTVTVDVEAERGDDGLWDIDLEPSAFEPETPVAGLLWNDVRHPCDAWLAANRVRVEKAALR